MSDSETIRPLVLKNKDSLKPLMVISLSLLAFTVALYPLFFITRRHLFFYCVFGYIIAFLGYLFCYWVDPRKNITVFQMDEKGVYFYDKKSHHLEWSELKHITAKWCYNEFGVRERGLRFTTRDDEIYEFCVFRYFTIGRMAISRLEKTVDYFSKGCVPFEYNSKWNISSK